MVWKIFIVLFSVLFMVQLSYGSLEVIYKAPRPKKDLSEELKKTEKPEEEKYVYSPQGKTDPFFPFIKKRPTKRQLGGAGEKPEWMSKAEEVLKKLKEPKTELQRIDLTSLRLTAIIKTQGKTRAMVSDTKGKGYVLQEGTYIGTNGGVVDEIVCEDRQTAFGKQAVRKVIIKEPFVNRQGELDYDSIEMKLPYSQTFK